MSAQKPMFLFYLLFFRDRNAVVQYHTIQCLLIFCNTYHRQPSVCFTEASRFLLGCQYGKPSRNLRLFRRFYWVAYGKPSRGLRLVCLFYCYWVAYGKASRGLRLVCLFYLFYFFFPVSVKVLPVAPLLSGDFVHRAFCAYFLRIERVVEMRRFLWWTQ